MRRNLLPPENASATDTPSRRELLHLPWETGSDEPRIGRRDNPFHVVSWATEALDEVRREVWNHARNSPGGQVTRGGVRASKVAAGDARDLKRARCALWKNPGKLTVRQDAKLAWIEKTHPCLYRAWLLKEGIRTIFPSRNSSNSAARSAGTVPGSKRRWNISSATG